MLECLYETMLSIIILMDHFAPTLIGLGWFIPPNDHVFGMACIWQCVGMFQCLHTSDCRKDFHPHKHGPLYALYQ